MQARDQHLPGRPSRSLGAHEPLDRDRNALYTSLRKGIYYSPLCEHIGDNVELDYLVTKENGRKEIVSINNFGVSFNRKTGNYQTHIERNDVTVNDYEEYLNKEYNE